MSTVSGNGTSRLRNPTLPPIPPEYSRLEPLYEIQTVLAQAIGIEDAGDALLAIVTRTLRVRTAVLLDTTQELQRAMMWGTAGLAAGLLEEAREHAHRALGYLSRGGAASAHVVSRTAVLQGGVLDQEVVLRHYVTLPLVLGGRIFGVFQLEGARAFDERDLLFINVVVNQLAVALDRHHVQLELETSRADAELANRRLRDLQAIADAALEGATLDSSLSAVLRTMGSMFATDVAAVLLVNPDGKTLGRRMSIGLEDAGTQRIPLDKGAAGKIAAAGTALYFDDLTELDDVSPALRANGIRGLFGAPLRARGHLTGVVYVASRSRRGFAHDEVQLLELVAERIGTIIDNANLYEQALAAVRARDAVMGIVSHDLRNPLSAVQMATELLPADDPRLVRPVSIIQRSVDVMVRLINDLRDIGSIETGHLSVATRRESARSIVADAVEGLQAAIAKKSLHVAIHSPADELVLACDRVRIIQVLANLLSNAIKFTPAGGSITVSSERCDETYARFTIEDNGPGIPEADRARVFDRYWQAKETAHLGTGLGLAITKGIIEAHGGKINVTSTVGRGTTFTFTLPLAGEPAPGIPVDAGPPRRRVLVVDDEPNALSALAALLDDEGFEVATARDAIQALLKLREFEPELLLVDVELPGLRGPELAHKVREDLMNLPVILMSGHDHEVIATAQIALGASYIEKPIVVNDLVAAIHRELDREHM